jgi:hypothetical protein
MRNRLIAPIACLALAIVAPATAADAPQAAVPAAPAVRTQLPDEHPYQQDLRKYLASLTEKDFEHGVKELPFVAPIAGPDELYRTWLLTLEFPRIGRKRSAPSTNLPSVQFTLAAIENPTLGIIRPACWPEPAAWLANWNYKGNPYFGSRAMKLRAFVTASVLMLMTDDLQEHSPAPKDTRSDWFGPHLIAYAYTYNATRDVLPPEARTPFETCLKKMMQRVTTWGPRRDETHFDIATTLGMRLAADAMKDAESAKLAEAYAKRIFSDDWYYNPAGYFTDQGCIDGGFNGMSLYWGTWLALAAPDWPFVQEAVKKAWRLRGYLALPEPDGAVVGPAHFNARTSSDVVKDQWDWPFRAVAASFLTDDAACQAKSPTAAQLETGPAAVVAEAGAQIKEKPGSGEYVPNEKLKSAPWHWALWPDSAVFPMNNYAYDFYSKGYFAHRQELEKSASPFLKYPFAREGTFTEVFGKVFLIAKRPAFGVIIHTGPVSEFQGAGHIPFTGPYGLSGGSLSAFWTAKTGTVLLGRRGGMTFPNSTIANFDPPELWRAWPVHAVTGVTAAGKVFTSARIQKPDVVYEFDGPVARAKAAGVIPSVTVGQDKSLEGKINYARTFALDEKGLHIETTISGDGQDEIAELYEVLPVFLRELERQPKAVPTRIEFQIDGKWMAATDHFSAGVQAVRLTRFAGAAEIRFDQPRRVKLSPADWNDKFLGHASCRNVLIDLLENGDKPARLKNAKTAGYRIQPGM